MWLVRNPLVLLAICCGIFLAVLLATRDRTVVREFVAAGRKGQKPKRRLQPAVETASARSALIAEHADAIPVPLNRGSDVENGFGGDVHPALRGETNLPVTAHWETIQNVTVKGNIQKLISDETRRLLMGLAVRSQRRNYTGRMFSAFLPQDVRRVGQLWSLDQNRLTEILKQFHPNPSMKLAADGRRAGPNGAFAILRAKSRTHWDIAFRIHAEFVLAAGVWYTPACFTGRILINTERRTVDFFQLKLPTERALNVHLTLAAPDVTLHDIVRVNRMELIGGNPNLVDELHWDDSIGVREAHHELKNVFYKFAEIQWVPTDQALSLARTRKKPIMAIVLWGGLEDQSC